MSRTWHRTCRKSGAVKRSRRYERGYAQPETISPEWLVEHMTDRINFIVQSLIDTKTIGEEDREEYASILKAEALAKLPTYRDDIEEGETDRKGRVRRQGSVINYIQTCLHNKMVNIIESLEREERVIDRETPVGLLPEDSAERFGFRGESGPWFSDGCRSGKEVDFCIDVNTLVGCLVPSECRVFRARLNGLSLRECGESTGFTVSKVRRLMEKVAKKAKRLGFEPPISRWHKKIQK